MNVAVATTAPTAGNVRKMYRPASALSYLAALIIRPTLPKRASR